VYLIYLSFEPPAFGLGEQVARVFRDPGAIPTAPQNLPVSFETTCRSDELSKPFGWQSVESFFETMMQSADFS